MHVYTCHGAIGRPEDNSGELILSFHFVELRVSCFCCFTAWLAGLWLPDGSVSTSHLAIGVLCLQVHDSASVLSCGFWGLNLG